MSKYRSFLKKQAHDVFWGEGNPDHPSCPNCGSIMNFHSEGYWDCPGCNYSFTEQDLDEFDVSIY